MERIKPNFRELFSAFWGSKRQQEESERESNSDEELDRYMEKQGFEEDYKKSRSFVRSLEVTQEHPDEKVKAKGRREAVRKQDRLTSKTHAVEVKSQSVEEEDREPDR